MCCCMLHDMKCVVMSRIVEACGVLCFVKLLKWGSGLVESHAAESRTGKIWQQEKVSEHEVTKKKKKSIQSQTCEVSQVFLAALTGV